MARKIIEVKNLSFSYKGAAQPALSEINFEVCAGEHLALLGANGSGKTTLLGCLNGLLSSPSGSVAAHSRLGTVLQNPDDQIISSVVEEDIAFGPENLGLDAGEVKQRVDEVLRICNLEKFREKPPHFLSGGEKQRLALAGVLALDTEIIALDEAVSMLDPAGREDFLQLLTLLNRSGEGKTIIQVTHSLEEASRCGRCIVLSKGVLVFDGKPEALLEKESELETWGFQIPESIKAVRALSRAFSGFHVSSLNPAETAAKLAEIGDRHHFIPSESPAQGSAAAIVFKAVSHEYQNGTRYAAAGLQNVSFDAGSGTLAIIGKSGSGKSTLLKHINAVLLPAEGRVLVLGEDTLDKKTKLSALRMKAALSVQNPESALFEFYAADDVAFGPKNCGLAGKELLKRVTDAMAETGLPYDEFGDRATSSLSGGEKRRAAIAGSAAMESEILLLDEPFSGLDGFHQQKILSLINKRRETGQVTVLSTHSMETATAFDTV